MGAAPLALEGICILESLICYGRFHCIMHGIITKYYYTDYVTKLMLIDYSNAVAIN